MSNQLNNELKHTPIAELLKITEALYLNAVQKIRTGEGVDQSLIAAANAARKEIDACKKAGLGE